jgi:hypothetical protein
MGVSEVREGGIEIPGAYAWEKRARSRASEMEKMAI